MDFSELLHMSRINRFEEFKSLCISHGFVCRGKAFFRVIGDGVLQVLKYTINPRPYNPSIDVGLFSLFGELCAEWVTYRGCIPRYVFCKLFNDGVFVGNALANIPEIDNQLIKLNRFGFEWLDRITTQELLAEAMCQLDYASYKSIGWTDFLKYDAFLASRQYDKALKVVELTISQYETAVSANREYFSEEEFRTYLIRMQHDMDALKRKLIMVKEKDGIDKYLMENFARNQQLTKFCRR